MSKICVRCASQSKTMAKLFALYVLQVICNLGTLALWYMYINWNLPVELTDLQLVQAKLRKPKHICY